MREHRPFNLAMAPVVEQEHGLARLLLLGVLARTEPLLNAAMQKEWVEIATWVRRARPGT